MRLRRALPLALALAAAPLAGCATILHGPNQTIHVETDPPGATVSVNGERHASPVDLVLPRSAKDLVVLIEKDGYAPKKIALERATSKQTWLNFVGVPAGALAGASIGASRSGDGWSGLENGAAGLAAGGVLLPGIMFAVDGATGAIHRLDPPAIAVRLEPLPPAVALSPTP